MVADEEAGNAGRSGGEAGDQLLGDAGDVEMIGEDGEGDVRILLPDAQTFDHFERRQAEVVPRCLRSQTGGHVAGDGMDVEAGAGLGEQPVDGVVEAQREVSGRAHHPSAVVEETRRGGQHFAGIAGIGHGRGDSSMHATFLVI